jgi:hypothetical protein
MNFNGSAIADFTPERIFILFFARQPTEPLDSIDRREPVHILEILCRKIGQHRLPVSLSLVLTSFESMLISLIILAVDFRHYFNKAINPRRFMEHSHQLQSDGLVASTGGITIIQSGLIKESSCNARNATPLIAKKDDSVQNAAHL